MPDTPLSTTWNTVEQDYLSSGVGDRVDSPVPLKALDDNMEQEQGEDS
jgi:hypothetical protein